MPIFRWDIDKTYLETDFESLSGLWRAATEDASEKISADGVVPLVKGLKQNANSQLVFLSGSPKQMQTVLLKKFELDGIEVDKIILKDSLKAIRTGHLADIKNQFGHKLPHLLEHRVDVQSSECAKTEYLFGDDVEQDALIYLTYRLILEGKVQWRDLKRLAKITGSYSRSIDRIRLAFSQIDIQKGTVRGVFIRLTKHIQPDWMSTLIPHLYPVHTWSQAAMILLLDGVLSVDTVHQVCKDESLSATQIANLIQDIQIRGLVSPQQSRQLQSLLVVNRDVIPLDFVHTDLHISHVHEAYRRVV